MAHHKTYSEKDRNHFDAMTVEEIKASEFKEFKLELSKNDIRLENPYQESAKENDDKKYLNVLNSYPLAASVL